MNLIPTFDAIGEGRTQKGNPEFNPDQPRDDQGRWSGGGDDERPPWGTVKGLQARFPGAKVTIQRLGITTVYTVKDDRGFDFQFFNYPGLLGRQSTHFSWLGVPNDREGRNKARDAVLTLYDAAKGNNSETIELNAGLASGGYVWPNMGWDVANPARLVGKIEERIEEIEERISDADWDLDPRPTPATWDKVRAILASPGPDMGTRLAHLDDPVDQRLFDAVIDEPRGTVRPTWGKLLLLGVEGVKYQLPRERFDVLRDWANRYVKFGKGYPEFNPGQERDELGRWSGGSGTAEVVSVGRLSGGARRAIEWYAGNPAASQLNRKLGRNEPLTSAQWRLVAGLDDFTHSFEVSKEGVVYRGVTQDALDRITGLSEGTEFAVNRFTSTSLEKEFSWGIEGEQDFGSGRLQITLPKGLRVGYDDGEMEVLLPRGTRYRYDGRQDDVVLLTALLPVGKGNPEYRSDQPRDERGRWSGGSGHAAGSEGDQFRGLDNKWWKNKGTDDNNPAVNDLRKTIDLMVKMEKQSNHRGRNVLLKEHGRSYRFDEKSFQGDKTTQHKCYQCAGRAAMGNRDLTYVEGYVSIYGVPIEHAWVVDKNGYVIDPTLRPDSVKSVKGYLGIPFRTDYVIETALRTKVWGLISHTNRTLFNAKPSTFLAKRVDKDDEDDDRRRRRVRTGRVAIVSSGNIDTSGIGKRFDKPGPGVVLLEKGYPEFNPNQLRDSRGRFAAGGGGEGTKDEIVRTYNNRLTSAVKARSLKRVAQVVEAMRGDKRVTIKRLEQLLGRRRNYLENTRAKLLNTVLSRAKNLILTMDQREATPRP